MRHILNFLYGLGWLLGIAILAFFGGVFLLAFIACMKYCMVPTVIVTVVALAWTIGHSKDPDNQINRWGK